MKFIISQVVFSLAILYIPYARADSFGSGASRFDIEFVLIGDVENAGDITGFPNSPGKVDYSYRMGKYEISREMITKANDAGGLGITMHPMIFIDGGARDKMPATSITWFEAALFVNWLNTSTGHTPAYKFNSGAFELWQPGDAGYNPANPFRNRQSFYVLPNSDEWYKAAYYEPTAGVYYNYPTGSDARPESIASGSASDTAVYQERMSQGPADIMLAGGQSPYGTVGQGGNVFEWEETEFDFVNDEISSDRAIRGGNWYFGEVYMRSSSRYLFLPPRNSTDYIGFRVASVPEPSTALVGVLMSVGTVILRRR